LAFCALSVADRNFQDVAVLAEELGLAQRLEQFVFAGRGCQAGDVDEVLLYDTDANEAFAILLLCFSFLDFFLPLVLSSLLPIFLNLLGEFNEPESGQSCLRRRTSLVCTHSSCEKDLYCMFASS